jgi:hypothetical protein
MASSTVITKRGQGMSGHDDDLNRAYWLLGGCLYYNKRGLPFNKYLKEGDAEEVEARMAIAKLLRSRRVNGQLLDMLASLFDPRPRILPNCKAHPDFLHIDERRIVFRYRARGNRNNNYANTVIAQHVWQYVRAGGKIEKGVVDTAEKFKLSREQVMDVWSRYKGYMREQGRWEDQHQKLTQRKGEV